MIPTEQQEHLALMKWIKTQPKICDVIVHIPNEGKRDVRYGNKLKRMGLRAGVSDFFIPIPKNKYHGLWIELKRQKGSRISPEQKEWIQKMNRLDYSAHLAYGFENAKDIIIAYMDDALGIPVSA